MIKFIPFYFEGNQRWGWFNTPEEVEDLLKFYDYKFLRKARAHYTSSPYFGFYSEYNKKYTLGEWIDKNNQNKFFNIKKERLKKLKKLNK